MKYPLWIMLALFAVGAGVHAAVPPSRPTLQVTTLDGAHFDLDAQRGHWVIVNFWATWCRPCIKEMPDISRFVDTHANVMAIGLAFEDSPASTVRAFVKAHPVRYPIAQVDVYHPPADFAMPRGLPTTYLIAPDGTVAKKFVGPVTALTLAKAIGAKPTAK